MKNTLAVTTPSDLEIVISRNFDAPRALVWEAMSKPEFQPAPRVCPASENGLLLLAGPVRWVASFQSSQRYWHWRTWDHTFMLREPYRAIVRFVAFA